MVGRWPSLAVLAVIGRPLLFASVDPDVAAARGVPGPARSAVVFLVLLGRAAAEASQITGSLLVFALLVLPAATAQPLTARPVAGPRAGGRARRAVTWLGPRRRYYSPYPIGFFITTLGFAAYVLRTRPCASGADRARGRGTRWPRRGGARRPRLAEHARRSRSSARVPRRHRDRRGVPAWSATSWCCAARSSPATRSATSPSPARWPRWPLGVDLRLGLFAATDRRSAPGMGLLGRRGRADDVRHRQRLRLDPRARRAVPVDLHGGSPRAPTAPPGSTCCSARSSGSSSSRGSVRRGHARSCSLAVRSCIARPLLFASLDEAVAAARGVPVTVLGIGFLALVGVTAAEATQAVGALLLLGPAGRSGRRGPPVDQESLRRHGTGRGRSSAASMAVGLIVSYLVPSLPPSFSIIATAALVYAVALLRVPAPRKARDRDRAGLLQREPQA